MDGNLPDADEAQCSVITLDLFKPGTRKYPEFDYEEIQSAHLGECNDEEQRFHGTETQSQECKKLREGKKIIFGGSNDQINKSIVYDVDFDFADEPEYNELVSSLFDAQKDGFYVNKGILETKWREEEIDDNDVSDPQQLPVLVPPTRKLPSILKKRKFITTISDGQWLGSSVPTTEVQSTSCVGQQMTNKTALPVRLFEYSSTEASTSVVIDPSAPVQIKKPRLPDAGTELADDPSVVSAADPANHSLSFDLSLDAQCSSHPSTINKISSPDSEESAPKFSQAELMEARETFLKLQSIGYSVKEMYSLAKAANMNQFREEARVMQVQKNEISANRVMTNPAEKPANGIKANDLSFSPEDVHPSCHAVEKMSGPSGYSAIDAFIDSQKNCVAISPSIELDCVAVQSVAKQITQTMETPLPPELKSAEKYPHLVENVFSDDAVGLDESPPRLVAEKMINSVGCSYDNLDRSTLGHPRNSATSNTYNRAARNPSRPFSTYTLGEYIKHQKEDRIPVSRVYPFHITISSYTDAFSSLLSAIPTALNWSNGVFNAKVTKCLEMGKSPPTKSTLIFSNSLSRVLEAFMVALWRKLALPSASRFNTPIISATAAADVLEKDICPHFMGMIRLGRLCVEICRRAPDNYLILRTPKVQNALKSERLNPSSATIYWRVRQEPIIPEVAKAAQVTPDDDDDIQILDEKHPGKGSSIQII